ncbi:DUF2953 domain-containing protein [Virgibacillus kekensis]|uniref:DUF2953 domain-containing protein n=1 Tax=Virgibacillus kekensis TaxID=202261 RepID=A0ABV9DD58_9BACI
MVELISGIFIIGVLLLFSKVKVSGEMFIGQKKQVLSIAVYIYGVRLIRRQVDLSGGQQKDKTFREVLDQFHKMSENFGQKVRTYGNIASILLKPLTFRKLAWTTRVGTGDASSAGMTAGGIWAAKGTITGLLSVKCTLKCNPLLEVIPLFNQRFIQSELDCIVTVRIGKAIYAFLMAMRKLSTKKQAFI